MAQNKDAPAVGKDRSSRAFWNMLFSAADPELKEVADKIRKMIPDDSLLRSKIAERVVGILKGWVESKAEGMSPVAGAVVEKLTDLGDFFVGGETDEKKERATRAAQDWMDKFFDEAGKRLAKTDPANLEAEKEKILREFKLRKEILEAVEAVRKEAQGPTSTATPTEPINVGEKVDKVVSDWKTSAQRRGYRGRRRS